MLQCLEEERVIPILGPDLLEVNLEGTGTPLYPLLARKLAAHLGVSSEDLPGGSELQEVARRHLARSRDVQEIYRSVRLVFRELDPIPIPEPLLDLARIPALELFVTTTFDVLAELALDRERFDGMRQTLAFAYAPNDRQDLPPEFDRIRRPAVFHLFGRLSGTPHSFAVTREDTLQFLDSLQTRPPGFLFDKLRESDLLILGSPLSGWIARLLGRDRLEENAPVVFVDRRDSTTEASVQAPVLEFVRELSRRWSEISREEPGRSAGEVTAGAVYLSTVAADRAVAESIRDTLDRSGVDVFLEEDDSALSPRRDRKLRNALRECAAFVPVMSGRSSNAPRRFLQKEWVEAILEAARAAPAGRFVLPVVVDDASSKDASLPREFGELKWEKLPGGKPSSDFVKTLVELQRSYRRAKSA
ncbi:MAG TPA: toll/interleukin-1 receptor domain-containing protein [Vicinamibacteria bacterium]